MRAKLSEKLKAIERLLYQRAVLAGLVWLAVLMAFVSVIWGSRWAMASCALSLAVLTHVVMVMLGTIGMVAESIAVIRDNYKKEVQSIDKKEPESAKPMSAKVH
jgi:hypothetical protein